MQSSLLSPLLFSSPLLPPPGVLPGNNWPSPAKERTLLRNFLYLRGSTMLSFSRLPFHFALRQRGANPGPKIGQAKSIFDICTSENGRVMKLQKPVFETNREEKECERAKEIKCLRSGMMLLKNYIDHFDQVRIVEFCRENGIGIGGFYQPVFRSGAKLRLQMMCLGMNWDPESRLYEYRRSFDGSVPPNIPKEFNNLVYGALKASHEYLKQTSSYVDVEDEIPLMSPDICIVNFYSNWGKLGLHQDRDESKASLRKGLPVVSFSIGDSADFLYGETRDVDKAESVLLESGDVLIFGGRSRHVFHGVRFILPDSAPRRLIEETKLRPGRLNLTFRQY